MAEATILIEDLPVKDPNSKAKLITISGQLDESNVDTKAKEIYQLLETTQGKLSFIFDLAGLDYMNSKSIGYLTDWYGKITERGGKVLIAHAKPNIKDILQVVGLTQLIQMFESLDEAKTLILGATPQNVSAPAPGAQPAAPVPPQQTETFKLN
jgi:stage II sporulation protein AA (anti-sigma F factor antagonist)